MARPNRSIARRETTQQRKAREKEERAYAKDLAGMIQHMQQREARKGRVAGLMAKTIQNMPTPGLAGLLGDRTLSRVGTGFDTKAQRAGRKVGNMARKPDTITTVPGSPHYLNAPDDGLGAMIDSLPDTPAPPTRQGPRGPVTIHPDVYQMEQTPEFNPYSAMDVGYKVGNVDVAETPADIANQTVRQATQQAVQKAREVATPPDTFGNTATATPAQRMGDTFGLPGLTDLDRSALAQASAKFDPGAVKASGLSRLGPPEAPQVAGIGAMPAGIGALAPQQPGMVTDAKGTYADTFGNVKPGGIMVKASAPKFQESLTAPANLSPAPQPEQTVASAAPAQVAPDMNANAGWEARHPVNNAFDDQYGAAAAQAAPALAPAQNVPDYSVADVAQDPAVSQEPTIGSFPDAPAQSFAEANPKTSKTIKDAATGFGVLGVPGALAGATLGLLGSRLGPGFDAAAPDRYSTGSGLPGIMGALNGPKGAQGFSLSNPGMSVTSLGNGQSLRRSEKFGWTEVVGPDGSVVGIQYDNPDKKGLLGSISKRMGGLLGGKRSGKDISPGAQHAIDSGQGGLY